MTVQAVSRAYKNNPNTIPMQQLYFFLNENIKNDWGMLKSESGINLLLIAWSYASGQKTVLTPYLYQRMNYLAHAYLSFDRPEILAGNMISDYIKGKKQFDYPLPVQKGIRLHRAIDNYTDTHPATQELKSFFRPQYRLYSGAFADVVYDHFLANDAHEFSTEQELKKFAARTYGMLEPYTELFPLPFQKMFPYMKEYDWFYNYRYTWAIEKSFGGVVKRAAYLTESKIAFEIFTEHYAAMSVCYAAFFPDLKKFTAGHLVELLSSS